MKMRKSLFDKDHRYTSDADSLEVAAFRALAPIFADYLKKGYSPREISHILSSAVRDLECESLLTPPFLKGVLQRIGCGEKNGG